MDEPKLGSRSITATGWLGLAVFLSVLYPTIFAISKNWYAFPTRSIFLFVGIAAVAALFLSILPAAVRRIFAGGHRSASNRPSALTAALCSAVALTGLFYGALNTLLGNHLLIAIVFCVVLAGLSWLFTRGGQRYFCGIVALLTAISAATWLYGTVSLNIGLGNQPLGAKSRSEFSKVTFARKPNIYLLIYDAYGNREMISKLFDVDNTPHYSALEKRGFGVIDTFSNYKNTWNTTLAFFLGEHHYYDLADGVNDSRLGRSVMAGLAPNPVLETLRRHGYKTQFIHSIQYFLKDQGVHEYSYPPLNAQGIARVYGNPLINAATGQKTIFSSRVRIDAQTQTLVDRIADISRPAQPPWFTFSYFFLPKHSPNDRDWRQMDEYVVSFRKKLKLANDHMIKLVDRIRKNDPDALIIIAGDHGSWRYRGVRKLDKDPNKAFAKAGVAAESVALDQFSIVTAISDPVGQCQDKLYPTLTPVNVMRLVFACLSDGKDISAKRPADISFTDRVKRGFVAVRDGKPLPKWEPMQR